VLCSDVW